MDTMGNIAKWIHIGHSQIIALVRMQHTMRHAFHTYNNNIALL